MQKVSSSQIAQKTAVFCAKHLAWIWVILLGCWLLYVDQVLLFPFAIMSGVLARGGNEIIHLFYQRQRPYLFKFDQPLINPPKNLSFPSGHASFLLGISFFLFFFSTALGIVASAVALIVFSARVFCKVHWPSDILGSIFMALVSTAVVLTFIN